MTLNRNERIGYRTRLRDVVDMSLVALQADQEEDAREGLARLEAFKSEIEAAHAALGDVLEALEDAEAEANRANARTPDVVTRTS